MSASCQQRIATSPTLPIAIASLVITEIAPKSWSTSSAATVCLRTRDSAKATSSGTLGSRLWQTIVISKSSSITFLVYGLVGLVEEGSTFLCPATTIISGACPPPAPSEWKVWTVLPPNAFIVLETKPPSFNESV